MLVFSTSPIRNNPKKTVHKIAGVKAKNIVSHVLKDTATSLGDAGLGELGERILKKDVKDEGIKRLSTMHFFQIL